MSMSIPHLFLCPISLDLLTDPVTLSTGQTYDRLSIERWLAGGNLTCPVTMQRLQDTTLVPNHTLRHLIDQWLLTDCLTSNDKSCNFSLGTLKLNLQSSDTSLNVKLESVKKVRILSMESDTGQVCLIQLGFFPLLLQLILEASHEFNDDFQLVEVALDCILSLSPSSSSSSSSSSHLEFLNILKKDQNLVSLLHLLEQGNGRVKTSICYLIERIASSPVTLDLCSVIGQSQKVLQVLVSLITDADSQASEAAVRALSGICSLEANRSNAIKEGATDNLVAYLSGSKRRNATQALSAIEILSAMDEGKKMLIKNRNAVKILVKMLFKVSSDHQGSEHAVSALLLLCRESPRVRSEAVIAGALTQLLLLLQSQCSAKAKSKARALLKLLSCTCHSYHSM
ncbi:U-box domain-containing protein 26-like [Dioscorea cayenensis subsp. rotundata]|uniref:U-box domain-containing protein n=1 Tax=Dioscorea cayennensis subsp. rotundata TaxID=55577 RepID=A0AB40BAQ4_DIOCR|nr:U-box domain-containing protein 26-like [Dioscorea cayenensis subsp. rotundata]